MDSPQTPKDDSKNGKSVSRARKMANKVKKSLSKKVSSKDDLLEVTSRLSSDATQASASSGSKTRKFLGKPMSAIKRLRSQKTRSQESLSVDVSTPSAEEQGLMEVGVEQERAMEGNLGIMETSVPVNVALDPSVSVGGEAGKIVDQTTNDAAENAVNVIQKDLGDQKLEGGIKGKVTEQTVHAQGDEPIEILPSVDDGKVSDQEENVENDYLPGDAPEHIVPSNCQPKHIVKEADSGIRTRAINIEQLDLDPQSTSTSEAQSQEQPAGASHKNDWAKIVKLGGITAGAFLIVKLITVR